MEQSERYQLSEGVKRKFQTPEDYTHFFGYYYNSPLNSDGTRLLAHRVMFDGRYIAETDTAEIGYYDLYTATWYHIGNTRAFNWQQGAMLQWLEKEEKVIFNDRAEDHFKSVIVDLETGRRKELKSPIYLINQDAKNALTINYERLVFCNPHYSYMGVIKSKWNCFLSPDDGIFQVNLETGESKVIIRTEDIVDLYAFPELQNNAQHYLDHIIWNPTGSRFLFLHRYVSGAGKLITCLYSADPDGSNLYRFPDCNLYTHAGWRNDKEFFIWARRGSYQTKMYEKLSSLDNPLLKFARSTYHCFKKHKIISQEKAKERRRDGAAFMRMIDGSSEMEPAAYNILTRDGHPSWSRNGRFMLTDTYADEENYRHLMIFDYKKQQVYPLGKFYSPYNVHGYRCDLHPRFNHDEQYVIIDTAHTGRRQIYVLELDWNKIIR